MTCLNKFRISGLFTIDDKSFLNLGDLLNQILDETSKDKDYESAKFCMILSQTFYKISQDNNHPRIFLQQAIETHEIWKQQDFWEGIVKYSIHEEVNHQRNYNSYNNETQDERILRIQSISFGQLLSFTFNMLSFDIPKEKVKDISYVFIKNYKIPEEMGYQIIKTIDDYSETIDQKVKMDIIEDNLSVLSSVEIADRNIVILYYNFIKFRMPIL